MAIYCGITETLAVLPGLAQTSSATGYTDTAAAISNHAQHAANLIDSYCARRYALPLNNATIATDAVPPTIRTIAVDLTAYRVYRAFFSKDAVEESQWPKTYKEAIATLEAIREGEMDLYLTSGALLAERAPTSKLASSNIETWPVFDLDTITSAGVGTNQRNRISTGREST